MLHGGGAAPQIHASTGAARTGYPFTPSATTDAIRSAPLYSAGILVVGTTTGSLYYVDKIADPVSGDRSRALLRSFE